MSLLHRYCLLVGCCMAAMCAEASPTTVGSFTFDLPAGWERASAQDEQETGAWAFAYLKGATGGASPVVVAFSQKSATYKGEPQRTGYLKALRDGVRAKHASSFRAEKATAAGVAFERLRFVEDGETVFYVSPYNGERIFLITVTVPKPGAQYPAEAEGLLSTLKIAGPAYKPPPKRGFLDNLMGELDKAQKTLDDVLGALTGDTKKRDTADAEVLKGDTTKVDTPAGQPLDTGTKKLAPPTYIAIDAPGRATAVGLVPGDRIWAGATTKPVVRAGGTALRLPYLPDVAPLTRLQHGGGAATAFAAMRELAGPLDPTSDAKLYAKWAPYVSMPPEGGDEYFGKLNPILQETLALRTAAATAAAEFDSAWEEAVVAAAYDSEDGVREALAIGDQQRALLEAIQARMAELAAETAKLGSPPDPIAAQAAAHKNWRDPVKVVRDLAKPSAPVAGAWVLKRVIRTDRAPDAQCGQTKLATTMTDTRFRYLATTSYTRRIGGADPLFSGEYLLDVSWRQPPAMAPGGSTAVIPFSFTHRRTGNDIEQLIDSRNSVGIASDVFVRVDPRDRRLVSMYDKEYGFEKGSMLDIVPGIDKAETGAKEVRFSVPAGKPGAIARLAISCSFDACRDDATLLGRAAFFRVYEYIWTTDPNAIANAGKDVEEGPAGDDAKERAAAAAFHEGNVRIIQANLAKDRAELAGETDPVRRASLEMRILQAESDLIAEQDLITSVETGKLVHRRTPFDDYAHDQFVRGIRENQVDMERFQRATAGLQRLAGMLPSGEAEEARRFIDRQMSGGVLAKMDMAAVQKIADALHSKVQGFVEKEQAKAQMDEAWAQANLETAERLKTNADRAMFVGSLFGGRGVMIAYQAVTGYVEGGPQEAVLRTASWASTPTYIAAEAFRGYHRPDENGNPQGWTGAAKDAGKAYVLAKLFEYGAGKAKQWVTGRGLDGMTAGERIRLAEFGRARTAGEVQAREFARAQADLERAARQGASPEIITRLQNNCRKAAATVHANPHAKNYLKYKGDFHAQRAYNAHMRSNHAEVEAKFHELMSRKGWNKQPLKEFRNAASGDSVGMDHDIGLDEAAAEALRQNGRPASLYQWQQDAQKAWDQAYGQVTGQSAKRSWETVTTSVHAESYKDLNWLGRDKEGIQKAWGQQAADVTRYKNWHMLNDKSLDRFTALQEVSRGTAKDIGTKLRPLLAAAKPKTPEASAALDKARRQWNKVQSILEAYGNNTIDPIYASRRIREVTGGKEIDQVVDEAAMLLESLAKQVGK